MKGSQNKILHFSFLILNCSKTLFHKDKGKGIPIGNLTSQFFANVYLNELDQYCKRGLGIKYYIRYVDDFILFSDNPNQLLQWKESIVQYLEQKLKLQLKDTSVQPVSVYKGIDFLGYFIKPRYTLVRRRVLKNYEKILKEYLPISFQLEYPFYRKQFQTDITYYKEFQARINSYLAHFCYANTYRLRHNLEKKIQEYNYVLQIKEGYVRIPKALSNFSRFRNQIQYFQKQFPKHILIVQVGRFYELYGNDFELIGQHFQFKITHRGNLRICGFPIKKTKYAKNWLKAVMKYCNQTYTSFVIFTQSDEIVENVKIRMPVYEQKLVHPIQLELFHNIRRNS